MRTLRTSGADRSQVDRIDPMATLVLNAVGIILIGGAWFGASGQSHVGSTFPYINIGIAGVLVVGIGNALYLYGLRRSVKSRLTRIQADRANGVFAGE
jgi:drug/metabolite transporter (DMT)-like permease